MKKTILTFLLLLIFFGTGTVDYYAETAMAEGQTQQVRDRNVTGLIAPIDMELSLDELPEIYEENQMTSSVRGAAAYRSEWDSYSSYYFYNQLTENQKKLWDKLDSMCYEYLIGKENLTGKEHYSNRLVGLDIFYYKTKAVTYSGLSQQTARDTLNMFVYSNPQYYFLQALSAVMPIDSGSSGYAILSINESFGNGEKRAAATAEIKAVIDSWISQVLEEPTELQKEKKIHDLICSKVSYDPYFSTLYQNAYNQTVYSVFSPDSDTTVCAGYSQAMVLLCNAVGIDCAAVTSESHEWNIIRIDGTWYYLDLTWNDLTEEETASIELLENIELDDRNIGYKYFNRSYEVFMGDEPQNIISHTLESKWTGLMPELVYDSGATWDSIGTVHTPFSGLLNPQMLSAENTITIIAPVGGTIYYTTDGSKPSISYSKSTRYWGPFTVLETTTVKAIVVKNGYCDSGISQITIVPQYTVCYKGNGGYIGNKKVTSISSIMIGGNTLSRLPSPKRKNYAFLGWYTKKNGGSKVTDKTKVSGNVTYYAQWGKINPKEAVIASAKSSSSKSMKIKIKNMKNATGYQIRYSLKSSMSSSAKQSISANSCTVKKLKKGKTYYLQARMYQTESVTGKKVYGAWSKKVKVKIK